MTSKKMKVFNYTVTVHPAEEGGFWAEVPALPGCFTQGETIEEITKYAREAIECFVAGLIRDGEPVPVEKETHKTGHDCCWSPKELDKLKLFEKEKINLLAKNSVQCI